MKSLFCVSITKCTQCSCIVYKVYMIPKLGKPVVTISVHLLAMPSIRYQAGKMRLRCFQAAVRLYRWMCFVGQQIATRQWQWQWEQSHCPESNTTWSASHIHSMESSQLGNLTKVDSKTPALYSMLFRSVSLLLFPPRLPGFVSRSSRDPQPLTNAL